MVIYIILRNVEDISVRPGDQYLDRRGVFRFLRVLRPAFIICSEEKQSIRRAVKNIWNTIPDIMSILFLLIGSILLFGLMAQSSKKKLALQVIPRILVQFLEFYSNFGNFSPIFGFFFIFGTFIPIFGIFF